MNRNTYEDWAPPLQGQQVGFAHSTTAARYEVPPSWKNQSVTFRSGGSDLYVVFGDSNVMASSSAVSVAVGETIATHWATAAAITAYGEATFPVGESTHVSVVSGGTTSPGWRAFVSSGSPEQGESLDPNIDTPALWMDAGLAKTIEKTAGAITVSQWRGRQNGYAFVEASAKPDLLNASAVSSGMLRPAVSFVAGSSEKLVCANPLLCNVLSGTNPYTLFLPVRRTAVGALHTLFSAGTDGSNNGRLDVTLDASDDVSLTRVSAAGTTSTVTYATTMSAAMWLLTVTFDGSAHALYVDRAAVSLSGAGVGDVGTLTKVAIGCRAYNTSTFDQYASAEIPEVLLYGSVLSAANIARVHGWLKRRYGK